MGKQVKSYAMTYKSHLNVLGNYSVSETHPVIEHLFNSDMINSLDQVRQNVLPDLGPNSLTLKKIEDNFEKKLYEKSAGMQITQHAKSQSMCHQQAHPKNPVLPAKSDSNVMFCLQYVCKDLESIDHLCINPIHRIG